MMMDSVVSNAGDAPSSITAPSSSIAPAAETDSATNGTVQTGLGHALDFLDQVKALITPLQFQEFLVLLKMFKSKRLSSDAMAERVALLFQDHPQLMQGFAAFLPPDILSPSSSSLSIGSTSHIRLASASTSSTTITPGPTRTSHRKRSVRSMKTTSSVRHSNPVSGANSIDEVSDNNATSTTSTTTGTTATPTPSTATGPTPNLPNLFLMSGNPELDMAQSLNFLTSVRKAYAHSPDVYIKFVAYLQDSFKKSLPLSKVVEDVGVMFVDRPEVLQAFLEFIPISALKQSHLEMERSLIDKRQSMDALPETLRKFQKHDSDSVGPGEAGPEMGYAVDTSLADGVQSIDCHSYHGTTTPNHGASGVSGGGASTLGPHTRSSDTLNGGQGESIVTINDDSNNSNSCFNHILHGESHRTHDSGGYHTSPQRSVSGKPSMATLTSPFSVSTSSHSHHKSLYATHSENDPLLPVSSVPACALDSFSSVAAATTVPSTISSCGYFTFAMAVIGWTLFIGVIVYALARHTGTGFFGLD
ncbi:hypothetical protein BASA50_007419 [Batrachochytrium salamandrivorans]|uniref:Histone deacetylase interacting domain-containing protein n=1 Tax=Batrachochytrium salamandrivorans TaxID=1357716 RepID=A0ABQ8F6Q2_9FUNG|nr:hypothetical protein BASA50_007419 [Batrachochytrium salamandrivorans]